MLLLTGELITDPLPLMLRIPPLKCRFYWEMTVLFLKMTDLIFLK